MQSISCQPFPKIKGTNYPAELSLGYRVPVGNPNFPSGCNSKQTEEKGKSILEMSKIFLASVIWKSICAFVNQTACLLCVQTQDKHHLSACSAPALTPGHFYYSSRKTIFLWVFLQSCKMRMFTFKSGATVMAFSGSSLWGVGSGSQETDLIAESRCPGGVGGGVAISSSTRRNPLVTFPNSHVHGIWVLPVHPPGSAPHLSPDLPLSSLLEECSFWSPFWLSLLKLHPIVECEGWGRLYQPCLLDFPLHLKTSSWCGFETSPFSRVPSEGLSTPESLLNHLHHLVTARATYTIILCILFFFNQSTFLKT